MKPTLLAPLITAWIWSPPPAKAPTFSLQLQGSAAFVSEDCVRLTPDAPWARGAVWSKSSLDLAQPFDVALDLSFGTKDELGADGIVFSFTASPELGWRGEKMGYARNAASFAIELDTYQNFRQNDPASDHLAFDVHGVTYHYDQEAFPLEIPRLDVVELPNLEDGKPHRFELRFEPSSDKLTVSLDGKERASYPASVIQRLFQDQPVFWGLSAATGRKSNRHQVCFR